MSEMKHKHLTTPWEAKSPNVFAGKDCIAICDTDNADEQTYEAKARLMAAAPDLLAALQKATIYLKHCTPAWRDGADQAAEQARAALAKATQP